MNNKVDESFSAFLDGEASELDIQRLLKSLDNEPKAFGRWHELSKTQAAMQDETIVDTALSFQTERPEQAVEANKTPWMKRLVQGGIAAAVATVVVTTVNLVQVEVVPLPVASTVIDTNEFDRAILAQQQFEAQQRLDLYLREHAEQASFTTGHVVVPAELTWVEAESE